MQLLKPIIYCIVDQEPTAFHEKDVNEDTFSFAVNLSLESRADPASNDPAEIDAEEAEAKQQFRDFLSAVRKVGFHLFSVDTATHRLTYVRWLDDKVSDTALDDPDKLVDDWLGKQPYKGTRYWTTLDAEFLPDTPLDADAAGASHRLRAAQAWNAPVGHRFSLTHIIRIPRGDIDSSQCVVLPFFDELDHEPNVPDPPELHEDSGKLVALDYTYVPLDEFGEVVCRTNLIGENITKSKMDLSEIQGLTPDGYVTLDKDAQQVHRLLTWFEARAASLMATNAALHSRSGDPEKDVSFEALFGLQRPDPNGATPTTFRWGSLVWFVVARLTSALDNLVLGLLKPVALDATNNVVFDRASEGDILAPLVSFLRKEFEGAAEAAKLEARDMEAEKIAAGVRAAVSVGSPLTAVPRPAGLPPKSNAELARTLRAVFGIEAPKDPTKVSNARELIWEALARYESGSGTELPVQAQTFAKTIEKRSVAVISQALLELEQPFQDEAGAEAAIIKLIASAGEQPASLIAKAYIAEIKSTNADLEQVIGAVDRALTAYRGLLESPFNGAEAVRRAAGSAVVRALLDFSKLPHPTKDSSAVLVENVVLSEFYSRRFGLDAGPQPGSFDSLAAALVVPDPETLLLIQEKGPPPEPSYAAALGDKIEDAKKHLNEAYADAIRPIALVNDPDARFIPDNTPQPLAIQIAANIDGSKLDEFAKQLNGIGVAIRRLDTGDGNDAWAHTQLADLRWGKTKDDEAPDAAAAIHPMLPATSDGRGTMFIEYQGFPFADRALDVRVAESGTEPRDAREPFYRHDPHDAADAFAKVPRLAYGRRFETFSFVTSNAGTLPRALQKSQTEPWMPAANLVAPGASTPLIGEVEYQRRTAIAEMAVVEKVSAGRPRRIGAIIERVAPLAKDYPRVGISAWSGEQGVRDVFREAGGDGIMIVGAVGPATEKPKTIEWRITGVALTGTPAGLELRFFHRHASGPEEAGTKVEIPPPALSSLAQQPEIVIRVEFKDASAGPPDAPMFKPWLAVTCGTESIPAVEVNADLPLEGWLRLILTSGSEATLTFASPTPQKADNVQAPLLLLAPPNPDPKEPIWRPDLTSNVTVTVSTPRVGYLDFERWFANADRYDQTFGTTPTEKAAAKRFMSALLAAYVMRHLDPKLAEAIDRLPDPAVEAIRLELMALDRVTEQAVGPTKAVPYDLLGKLKQFAKDLKAPEDGWSPAPLRKRLFDRLNTLFQFEVQLTPSGPLRLEQLSGSTETQPGECKASVPTGVVARLSMDALVPVDHFKSQAGHPSMFYGGLKQYAQRKLKGSHFAFPAAALHIETMYDDVKLFGAPLQKSGQAVKGYNQAAIALAERMIDVQAIERTRRFDLMTASAVLTLKGEPASKQQTMTRHWRLLSEIDVTTQRFRSGGRPIYHYINPRELRHEGKADAEIKHPALRLALDPEHRLAQFELEAFFDRADVDAHTVSQRLEPLPARTKLQEHHWESPSASYFRHRFTLRSRYSGALIPRYKREVLAWPTAENAVTGQLPTSAHGWTMRVAMLAELSRLLLTRPQLRALIPLTTAPGGERDTEPAPPVAAILQEPPLARAGLADRIASELKTGFGYGFEQTEEEAKAEKPGSTPQVEIRDARKEGGPDPRLDYRALRPDTALGLVLRGEGPMGLTFDNVNAPAPALPNSMMLLKPATLFGTRPKLEEFFAGIAMQRYVDPNWTASASTKGQPLAGERCWWIVPETQSRPSGMQHLLQYRIEGENDLRLILAFERRIDRIVLIASKLAIDGVGAAQKGEDKDKVEVALIAPSQFDGLAILHQPVAPGRYATAVFVRARAAKTEGGESNLPLMVTSFEWSPPKQDGKEDLRPVLLEVDENATAYETMASAPTVVKWTRTSRDFDFVHIAELEDGDWKPKPTHVREIAAYLDASSHRFLTFRRSQAKQPIWLRPSISFSPYPLHVHRHLGLISSRFLKELGTPAEIFCRTSADAELRHDLVTPEGKLDLDGNIFKPQEQIVRVVEFETRAAILCPITLHANQEEFRTYHQAYFDLVSTGFKRGTQKNASNEDKPAGTLRLFFRFVGPAAHVRGFSKVKLSLLPARELDKSQPPPPPPTPFTLEIALGNEASVFAVGIELVLQIKPDRITRYAARLLRSNGLYKSAGQGDVNAQQFQVAEPTKTSPGFFVSIIDAIGAGPGEFWTDVSLLHSPRSLNTNPFDFGWLFSAAGDGEPTALVAAPGLTRMVEAQARIVAVSPPIPIVSH